MKGHSRRRGSAGETRTDYTRSRRSKRVYLASVRLTPAEHEAVAFLRMREAKLHDIGLSEESVRVEVAKIRARLTLEAQNETARIVGLRRARVERRAARP